MNTLLPLLHSQAKLHRQSGAYALAKLFDSAADRITELEKELKETQNVIVAHQTADADGYIDDYGWVANWSEMKEGMVNLFEAHNLEQKAQGCFDVISECPSCENGQIRLIDINNFGVKKQLEAEALKCQS
jgi:hypothetical protein